MTYDPPQGPVVRRPAEGQAYPVTVIPTDTLPLEAQLADAMRDGLAVFDPSGNLMRWNSSARAITGWTPGEAGQRGLAALPAGVIEIREGKWADARHIQIAEGTAVLFTDVTAQVSLRDANRRLDDLALTEAVTGLPNRRLALGQITRAIALAKRDLRPVGLLCIDIDGFTRLNHLLGDVAGDQILRQVGERIAHSIRGSDMAARTAGGRVLSRAHRDGSPGGRLDSRGAVAPRARAAVPRGWGIANDRLQHRRRRVSARCGGRRQSLQDRKHGRARREARGGWLLQGRHGWCRHETRNQNGGVCMGIIVFLIVGLIAGFIARALVPGPDPMGWLGTMILGIVGSFVGGTLAALVFGGTLDLSASGIIGSIVGAIIVLLIWRAMGGRRGAVA